MQLLLGGKPHRDRCGGGSAQGCIVPPTLIDSKKAGGRSLALQPVSVETQVGVNLAVGRA